MVASAKQLNEMLAGVAAGTRVCVDANASIASERSTSAEGSPISGSAVILIPEDSACDLRFVWWKLAAPAAALVMPPESRGRVVFDPDQLGEQPFQNDDAPVWELIIRLAAAGTSIEVLPVDDNSPTDNLVVGDLLPIDAGLPEIAPHWPPRDRAWLAECLRRFQSNVSTLDAAPRDPVALCAGLWLIHDFLDESHKLSQSMEGRGADRNGDYWHGIMHRREPDWSNSKYWFRRVGDHPIFFELSAIAGQLLAGSSLSDADRWSRQLGVSNTWDPFAFVDLCQAAALDATSELASIARRIQWAEILLLLAHCS
ncbi:hypothetical protein GC176_13465 [bacterium]|nr:hypothetical protein [bacterium]